MKRILALAAALSVTLAACGDDSGGPGGPGGPSGNSMVATVGGIGFDPPSFGVVGTYVAAQQVLNVTGTHTKDGVTTQVTINLLNVDGPGTYPINPNFAGQFGQITKTTGLGGTLSTWTTVLAPGTGTVEITALDNDGAAGTFTFTGQAAPGTAATGQLTATSGSFDVEF